MRGKGELFLDKPIFDVAGLAENYVFRSPKPGFVSSRELDEGLGSNRPFSTSRRTRWLEALWANPRPKPLLRTGDPILPLHIKRPYPDKATQRRWKAEEPDLLKRVLRGDKKAARTLVLRYLPNLQQQYGSRLSAALEGFWRAVTLFKPGSNGLWAYARYEIKGQAIRQLEPLGFGNSSYGFLYSDAAPLGVSSDPGADEITGGKAPRRRGAETYEKGYCSNGVSKCSRSIAAYEQYFFLIRLGHKADDFALKCLRWMGRRRYANLLVAKDRERPESKYPDRVPDRMFAVMPVEPRAPTSTSHRAVCATLDQLEAYEKLQHETGLTHQALIAEFERRELEKHIKQREPWLAEAAIEESTNELRRLLGTHDGRIRSNHRKSAA
jgi:hypothetical protein